MLRLSGLRKRTQPLKYRRIAARVTDAELALIQHAAELQGQSVTCFVLATLQKEAMQVIGTMEAGRAGMESGEPGEVLLGAPREHEEYQPAAKKRNLKVAGPK
jgi:uncharacterized protein (DUF1778 family)